VDCTKYWKTKCETNVTGYFCEAGSYVTGAILKPAEYATSTPDPFNLYSSCVPYPYKLG